MAKKKIERALSVIQAEQDNLSPEQHARFAELAKVIGDLRKNATDRIVRPKKKLKLETQYYGCLETLEYYGFLNGSGEVGEDDIPPPSYEEAKTTFKPNELAIARGFQKPILLLIPEISLEALVKATDAHKQIEQGSDTVITYSTYTDSRSDKITGWRAVIVDGAHEMEAYDGNQPDLKSDERIEVRKAARKKGEKGMDRYKYALLMMDAVRNGKPIDGNLYTVLDDDPVILDLWRVPIAGFCLGSGRIFFAWDHDIGESAQFRSSVGGDVLLT